MITNDEYSKIIEIQEFQIKWANTNYLNNKKSNSSFACFSKGNNTEMESPKKATEATVKLIGKKLFLF